MVEVRPLGLNGLLEITPKRHADHRGFFSETWNARDMRAAGVTADFVQDNHACTRESGCVRGLHFQRPPFAQDKLVRVTRGAIFDVAVDIRRGSPTYGRWVGVELSEDNWKQILVPAGFAHGYLTLTPATEVIYKVSAPYSRAHEGSIRFDDADIGIEWPKTGQPIVLSDKDAAAPAFADLDSGFAWP